MPNTVPVESVTCPFDPVAITASDDPYSAWGELRRERPVFYSADHDVWAITRHADVLAAFKDHQRFSSRDAFTPMAELPPEVTAVLDDGWSRTALMRRNFVNLDPPQQVR